MQRGLEARAMPIAEAAEYLGVTVAVVHILIAGGALVIDDERGPRNALYVRGQSIEAFRVADIDRVA